MLCTLFSSMDTVSLLLSAPWALEPPRLGRHVWFHMLLAIPGSAELGPAQTCCEHDSVPASALLHAWLRPLDQPWISAVPRTDCARVDPANVRCQEHDVCCRSSSRSLPHSCLYVPRPHVNQGG